MTPRDRVRAALKKSGLTRAAFAAELGVAVSTLDSWMRNPQTDTSARTPRAIYVREAERIAESMALTAPRRTTS